MDVKEQPMTPLLRFHENVLGLHDFPFKSKLIRTRYQRSVIFNGIS